MELKAQRLNTSQRREAVLIVPFMELKAPKHCLIALFSLS